MDYRARRSSVSPLHLWETLHDGLCSKPEVLLKMLQKTVLHSTLQMEEEIFISSRFITQFSCCSKVISPNRQDILPKDPLQAAKVNLFLLFILLLLLLCCSVVGIYCQHKIFYSCLLLGKDGVILQLVC